MKINKNINCESSINLEDFKNKYFKPQKPVLIKGLANDSTAGKKWNLSYFKNSCGEITVDVFDSCKNSNPSSAYTKPDSKMKFSEYADLLLTNKETSLRIFLFNMFKKKPDLRKDFPCPNLFKGILGKVGYMFFGSKGTRVRIHQDIDMSSVLLTQFQGNKKVILIAPEYSELLYKLPYNTFSLINIDEPDYKKYPGLEYIEADEYILEPGDSLFMPSGYWHYITYLDSGFSVSYRKLAPQLKYKWKGLLNLIVFLPFDKLMCFCFGNWWLKHKEKLAEEYANKAIQKRADVSNYSLAS